MDQLVTVKLVPVTCCACEIVFGMSSAFYEKKMRDHSSFFCPKGHAQHFTGKTEDQEEIDRLRSALDKEERIAAYLRETNDGLRSSRDHAEASRRSYKGQVTKLKNRVGKGVCPCCNRYFENLGKHMIAKHPTWAGEEEEK